ncbi:hypothetical protein LCGC14_1302910, partial [marine sediment metagenome]
PENIFDTNFNPAFTTSLGDNLESVALEYEEKGFVISPYNQGIDTSGFAVPTQSTVLEGGDFEFDRPSNAYPPGHPEYDDPRPGYPGAYGDFGDPLGNIGDSGGTYSVIEPGYNWWGESYTSPTYNPTGVIGNDEFWQSGGTLLNAVQGGTPEYIYSYQSYGGQSANSFGVMRPEGPSTDTEQWTSTGSGSPPHAQWLDEVWDSDYNGRIEGSEANTDGAYIATNVIGYKDKWDFTNPILSDSIVSQIKVYAYTDNKHCPIEVTADFNDGGDPFIRTLDPEPAGYGWKSFTISNLAKGQNAINTFELMVEKKAPAPEDMDYWLETLRVDAVYIEVWIKMLLLPDAAVDFAAYSFPAYHGYRVSDVTVQVLAKSNGVGNGILDVYRYFGGWSAPISSYIAYGGAGDYTLYTFTFYEWANYISDPSDLRVYLHWYSASSESLVIDTVNIICTYRPTIYYQQFEVKWDIPMDVAIIDQLEYRFSQICPEPRLINLQIYSGGYGTIASNQDNNNGWIEGSLPLTSSHIQNGDEIWVRFNSIDYIDYNDFQLYLDQLGVRYYLGDRYIYNEEIISLNEDWARNGTVEEVVEEGISDDPFFGRNNYRYTLGKGNSLITPMFGRDNASAFTDISLTDVDFDFEVYFEDGYTSQFMLENDDIEGADVDKYDHTILTDPEASGYYSQSRFRNSAIDDIQIPLITPIELDFGSITAEEFSDLKLEIALDLDIDLANRINDSDWSFRFRLVYYNYTSVSWEDFKGLLQAKNKGGEFTFVWNSTERDFIEQLQDPRANYFIPITNENNLVIRNPILIDFIDEDMFSNGLMKLALISYILPSNFSIEDRPTYNYLVYERADPLIPINISQQVNVLECILLGESQQMMYPESSIHMNLPLNGNFRADLDIIEDLGDIVAVQGTYKNSESIVYEFPIYSYWITSNNELAFNSPMKYQFTNVSIEYIPQLPLIFNPTNGYWYLPNSTVHDQDMFVEPFFVSALYVNNSYYGTYVHPDIVVNYTIGSNSYGTFVEFTESVHTDSLVRGAVHFGKVNSTYLYRIFLADDLLYKYNVLNEDSEVIGGTLKLDLNVGFKDVLYSELSQVYVDSEKYQLSVNVSRLDTKTNELRLIGQTSVDLDSSLLGFHNYQLDIALEDEFFISGGKKIFRETLAHGNNYDLFVSVESSIYDCIVDGNLFKGVFAQELIRASFMLDVGEPQLISNGTQVETPYIPISQEGVPLTKRRSGLYQFNSLDYSSDFTVDALYTDTNALFESSSDYTFNSELNRITLIGDYRDYSGKLFANITYKTFEWNTDFISTLEPITFTFEKDYVQDITKYLEFIIGYNEIPGYDLKKIDLVTGRVVLSDEKKSPALLNIYLYNFIDDTWDLFEFVVYDDYSGRNSFSYVVDRNFITFEQYFNKTGLGTEEFQLKAIFTIEEDFGEAFISSIGFDIASIASNIYFNTPNTEHTINPTVEFDIDLTKYYTNPEIYLEQITVDLYYNSELEFDSAFLFSEYLLLQEQHNFYIRNEYLEFELFELQDDMLSLSRKELEHLIYYDIENDKYFLKAKIEYDWECIIEMNLGSNSKLEILAKLNLVKYDLSASYTFYETTRISAQETDIPFQLAAINAPNYIESPQGV